MGVEQVPLVGIHGDLILSKHAMVPQLGHPLLKQVLRFHLGDHTFNVTIVTVRIPPPTEATSHLQVKDVILRVQVDAHGLLLDGHDRQADVDAAVEFSLSQLERQNSVLESPHQSQHDNDTRALRIEVIPTSVSRFAYFKMPFSSTK